MKLAKSLFSSWLFRIAVAIAVMPAAPFLYLKLSGHLTPGPVSAMAQEGVVREGYASHADFEQECKHCHAPVHCITASRCQTCHIEIARQVTESEGLHARLPGTDRCQTCHVEHQGRDAVITEFPMNNLDHATLTGYSLDVHQTTYDGEPMACHDCHQDGTYASGGVDCATCHSAEGEALASGHVERFGGACLECHDGVDRMLAFDHQELFALEGSHAGIVCENCHQDHIFAGTAQDCTACHDEPAYHAGQFGTDCARCHTAVAWSPAELTQHMFDLAHQSDGPIPCTVCHIDTYTAYACDGCHEHAMALTEEQHALTDARDLGDCSACNPTGTREEIAQHDDDRSAHTVPAQPAASTQDQGDR